MNFLKWFTDLIYCSRITEGYDAQLKNIYDAILQEPVIMDSINNIT